MDADAAAPMAERVRPGPLALRHAGAAASAVLAILLAAGLAGLAWHSGEGLSWYGRAAGVGFLSGFAGGMVAGAIGLIAIPLLVFGLGLPIHQAAATNLMQTAATAGFGAWRHGRLRLLDLRSAGLVLLGSLAGAPLGAWTSLQIPADRLAAVFVAALLAAAAAMAWGALRPPASRRRPVTGASPSRTARPPRWPKAVALGAGLGFASGLLGVGAGFLVTPGLAGILGLPLHVAVGTGLAVIAGNSALASVPHVASGQVQWLTAGFMAFGGAFGVRLGGRVGRRMDERVLRAAMAAVLAAAAYAMMA